MRVIPPGAREPTWRPSPNMRRVAMAIGAACFGMWALASMAWPTDETLAAVATIIREGGTPYVDIAAERGPAAYYGFTAIHAVFGAAPWGLRLFDLLLHALAVIVMWRAYAPRFVGLGVAVIYGLWYAGGGPTLVGQPEGWVALGSIVCFAPLLFKRVPDWGFAVAGVFAAYVTLVDPAYVTFAAVPWVAWLTRRDARSLSLLIAGFVLPVAGCVGYMAQREAMHAMNTALFDAGGADLGPFVRSVGAQVFASKLTLLLPFAAFGGYALRGRFPMRFYIIAAWALAAFVALCLQRDLDAAGWLPLYPPLFVLACVGLKVIARTAMMFVAVTMLLMFAQAAWPPLEATWAWLFDDSAHHGHDVTSSARATQRPSTHDWLRGQPE